MAQTKQVKAVNPLIQGLPTTDNLIQVMVFLYLTLITQQLLVRSQTL